MKIEHINGEKMVKVSDLIGFIKGSKLKNPDFADCDYDIGWNDSIDGLVSEILKLDEA